MDTSDKEFRNKRTSYINIMVLMNICLALQIAGLFVPGWLVLDFGPSGSIYLGLFYMLECSSYNCVVKSIDGVGSLNGGLLEYRLETIAALVWLTIAGVVTLRLHFYQVTEENRWLLSHLTIVLSLGHSASLALVAAVRWSTNIDEKINVGTLYPPYGLIMTGISGVLALALCSILAEITYVQYNWRYSSESQHLLSTQQPNRTLAPQLGYEGDAGHIPTSQPITNPELCHHLDFQQQGLVNIQPDLHCDHAIQEQTSVKTL